MAFKKVGEAWVPNLPEFELGTAFAAGVWNIGEGGSRFTPPMRKPLTLAEKFKRFKKAGVDWVEFHDTEAEVADAPGIAHLAEEEGVQTYMCTANLFKRGPEFANGNFACPSRVVRAEAIRRTQEYIAAAIEIFGAKLYVYWNGSNGISVPLGMKFADAYKYTAESIAEVIRWMVGTYGPERALPFCIEPKDNEPPGKGIPADAGEALSIISLIPEELRAFVGLNLETCHSKLGGKRYAMELGLAHALLKLFYCHLNDGNGYRFDEDRAFASQDFGGAVESAYTLLEVGYRWVLGLDVQPFNTDTDDQQEEAVAQSVRNFRRALFCASRIDSEVLNEFRLAGNQAGISDLFVRAVSGVD